MPSSFAAHRPSSLFRRALTLNASSLSCLYFSSNPFLRSSKLAMGLGAPSNDSRWRGIWPLAALPASRFTASQPVDGWPAVDWTPDPIMCSVVILFRPGHDWPVIVGANRDEMAARPWTAPARHWSDRSHVVAGLDKLAGGSWLGINDQGVLAAVMNRMNSLGPAPGRRSRGELVLEALDHADATEAVKALQDLDPAAYRAFNMVVADSANAYWLRNLGHKQGW